MSTSYTPSAGGSKGNGGAMPDYSHLIEPAEARTLRLARHRKLEELASRKPVQSGDSASTGG